MPPVAEEVARVRSLAALTAAAQEWPAEQLEAAEHIAERLERYATAIVEPDGGVPQCSLPGCPLDHPVGGPAAVRLARFLADAARGHSPHAGDSDPSGDGTSAPSSAAQSAAGRANSTHDPHYLLTLHRRYVSALVDAAAVVYCCRRVLHTGGQCFFDADGPASGLCGRVLAVSHQLQLNPLAAS